MVQFEYRSLYLNLPWGEHLQRSWQRLWFIVKVIGHLLSMRIKKDMGNGRLNNGWLKDVTW